VTLGNRQSQTQRRRLLLVVAGIVAALAFAGAVGVGGASGLADGDAPAQSDATEFAVSLDGVERAEPGSTVSVNVTVEPTEAVGTESGRAEKIDWFELPVAHEGLELQSVEEAAFGSVEVERRDGSVFLDSDEELRAASAPITLATLEFTVTAEDGDEVTLTVGDDARIGWGPDWLRPISIFHHDTSFEGTTIDVEELDSEQRLFEATNTGGYIVLGQEDDTLPAPDNRTAFSPESIEIEAVVDNGTWVSTDVAFPTVEAANGTVEFDFEFPDGLSGEFDPDADRMTAEGELAITPSTSNESVAFDVRATTDRSGDLTGTATLDEDGGTVRLVDNQFTQEGCQIFLPPCVEGQNYLELPLEIDFSSNGPGGVFHTRVVDSIGRPIENASVTAGDESTRTDADGRAQISIDPDTVAVIVDAYGSTTAIEDPKPTDTYRRVRIDALPPYGFDFAAMGEGGFLAVGEQNISSARTNGFDFSEGLPVFVATVENNTWETGSLDFGTVSLEHFDASVTAPDGLSGRIDPATGLLTASGTLSVDVVQSSSFRFDIDATTGDSGALSGSGPLTGGGETVTLVDNEFAVEGDTNSPIVDAYLGLPSTETGTNWFELSLTLQPQVAR
jgi:hypothetical protein